MPTMNVSLPKALAEFVEAEVASGAYSTASEVVRDGLRMLREERAVYEEKLAILRREIQIGIDEVEAGISRIARWRKYWLRSKPKTKPSAEPSARCVRNIGSRHKPIVISRIYCEIQLGCSAHGSAIVTRN